MIRLALIAGVFYLCALICSCGSTGNNSNNNPSAATPAPGASGARRPLRGRSPSRCDNRWVVVDQEAMVGGFSDQAYNLILLAEDEARMLGQASVQPEHVLLALARVGNVEGLLARRKVTAADIHRALSSALPAHSISGVAKRTHATWGRCQGTECLPDVTAMICQHLGLRPWEVPYGESGSTLGVAGARHA